MEAKKIEKLASTIQQDPQLRSGEKLIVCLDRECLSMLEDAYLLSAEGTLQQAVCASSISADPDLADDAEIQSPEDGSLLVAFHETRPNSKTHCPNGIRVNWDSLDFPCVVFYNAGSERLTVEGEWIAPGEYHSIQDVDNQSPEGQAALLKYMSSPEVQEGIAEAQRMFEEKKRQR